MPDLTMNLTLGIYGWLSALAAICAAIWWREQARYWRAEAEAARRELLEGPDPEHPHQPYDPREVAALLARAVYPTRVGGGPDDAS